MPYLSAQIFVLLDTVPQYSENPFGSLFWKNVPDHRIHLLEMKGLSEARRSGGNNIQIVDFHWVEFKWCRYGLLHAARQVAVFLFEILLLKRRGVRICWTAHNIKPHESKVPALDFLAFFLLAHLSDAIIVFSSQGRKDLKKRFFLKDDNKIHMLPHAAYNDYYPQKPSKEEARRRLGIPVDRFVYFFFGLVRRYKGVDLLMREFDAMKTEKDLLLVAGKPLEKNFADELEAKKGAHVVLNLRHIEDHEVPAYFAAADVCVFPFREIATTGSVLLAMTFGKPIICARKGACIDIIKNEFGILYEEGYLPEAMIEIKNRNLAEMGASAGEAAGRLRWSDLAEGYRNIYLKLAGGNLYQGRCA